MIVQSGYKNLIKDRATRKMVVLSKSRIKQIESRRLHKSKVDIGYSPLLVRKLLSDPQTEPLTDISSGETRLAVTKIIANHGQSAVAEAGS